MNKKEISGVRGILTGFIITLLVALGVFLGVNYGTEYDKPFAIFLVALFSGLGLTLLVATFICKDVLYLVAGGLNLLIGLCFLFAWVLTLGFLVTVIVVFVYCGCLLALTLIWFMPKLNIEFDNEKPGYKSYKDKKQEEAAKQQAEISQQEENSEN